MSKTPEELANEYELSLLETQILFLEERMRVRDAYLSGYKAATPQWISVKDRLPKVEEQVLVYGRASLQSARFVQPAMLKKRLTYGEKLITDELWWDGYDIIGYDGETDEIVEVTHWMPLPNPPKNTEQT